MYTPVFWIKTHMNGQLGLMARPRGGEWLPDELHALSMRKVGLIVSALDPLDRVQYGLEGLETACHIHGLELCSFPMLQKGIPTDEEALQNLQRKVLSSLDTGTNVVIQSGRGQGRAPLLAAVFMQAMGYELPETLTRLRKAVRGQIVPKHPAQQTWLRDRYPAETSIFQDS